MANILILGAGAAGSAGDKIDWTDWWDVLADYIEDEEDSELASMQMQKKMHDLWNGFEIRKVWVPKGI